MIRAIKIIFTLLKGVANLVIAEIEPRKFRYRPIHYSIHTDMLAQSKTNLSIGSDSPTVAYYRPTNTALTGVLKFIYIQINYQNKND